MLKMTIVAGDCCFLTGPPSANISPVFQVVFADAGLSI